MADKNDISTSVMGFAKFLLSASRMTFDKKIRWFELRTVIDTTILKHAEIQTISCGIGILLIGHGFRFFFNYHQVWAKTSRVSRVFKSYSLLIYVFRSASLSGRSKKCIFQPIIGRNNKFKPLTRRIKHNCQY